MRVSVILSALAVLLTGCDQSPPLSSTPLTQQAYVWQRDWTPLVNTAVNRSAPKLDGLIVLGAQISWKNGKPSLMRPDVDWKALAGTGKPVGIGLRIDPFSSGAFDPETLKRFAEVSQSLIATAKEHGVR